MLILRHNFPSNLTPCFRVMIMQKIICFPPPQFALSHDWWLLLWLVHPTEHLPIPTKVRLRVFRVTDHKYSFSLLEPNGLCITLVTAIKVREGLTNRIGVEVIWNFGVYLFLCVNNSYLLTADEDFLLAIPKDHFACSPSRP